MSRPQAIGCTSGCWPAHRELRSGVGSGRSIGAVSNSSSSPSGQSKVPKLIVPSPNQLCGERASQPPTGDACFFLCASAAPARQPSAERTVIFLVSSCTAEAVLHLSRGFRLSSAGGGVVGWECEACLTFAIATTPHIPEEGICGPPVHLSARHRGSWFALANLNLVYNFFYVGHGLGELLGFDFLRR